VIAKMVMAISFPSTYSSISNPSKNSSNSLIKIYACSASDTIEFGVIPKDSDS